MLTLQEIFDKGLTHMRKQRRPSFLGLSCVYRDGKGNACIAGGLFPDSVYDPVMEKGGAIYVMMDDSCESEMRIEARRAMMRAMTASGVDLTAPEVLNLITGMQAAHDMSAYIQESDRFMNEFHRKMQAVAQASKLEYKEEHDEEATC